MTKEQAIDLTKEICQLYFVERDCRKLMDYFSKDIIWIGRMGKERFNAFEAIQKYLLWEKGVYNGSFHLENEEYHVLEITEDMICVLLYLEVYTLPEAEPVFAEHVSFTILYRKEGQEWKILHIHNSFADRLCRETIDTEEPRQYKEYLLIKEEAFRLAAREVEEVRKMDALTSIYNMEGFVECTENILQDNSIGHYAILKFGINQFRYLNHVLGYRVGDNILREIALNLKKLCRAGEICARIEKDNFAILLQYENREDLDVRIEGFWDCFIDEETETALDISVHFSGGVCLIEPGSQESVKQMLDKAMLAQQYRKSRKWENHYVYYDPEMERSQLREQELVESARYAMKRDEFCMYFQPQVYLNTGDVAGTEVLVRWLKPDKNIVMPDEFIPVFEHTGFIKTLDFYMLEKLCRHMREWLDEGLNVCPVSINQSRLHLEDQHYVEQFCSVVDRFHIPHELIAFELTESAFTEYDDMIQRLAAELHRHGFRLDIDDFGTGYTALNLLMQIEPDVLKMDRSLTANYKNPRGQLVLKKMIEIAKETGTTIICEGVEYLEQEEYFKLLQCDIAQGYYYYRPMPEDEFVEKILKRKSVTAEDVKRDAG